MSNRLPCSRCGTIRDIEIVERLEQVTIKGKEVSFNARYSRCLTCGDEFEAPGRLDANLDAAREAYARLYEAPSPEALVSLRARYNASQKAFGAILGFGELTMNGYENGGTPNSTNRLLLKLAADPLIFKAMYDINSGKIGAIQRRRIEESEGYRSAEGRADRMPTLSADNCADPGPPYDAKATTTDLSRHTVLEKIRLHKNDYERDYGIVRIGVFGSVARDEADEASDVDIVVEMREPDLFQIAHIREALMEVLGRPVDIVSLRKSMNEALRARILREVIYA